MKTTRRLAFLLALLLCFTLIPAPIAVPAAVAAQPYGSVSRESMRDGVILHAWCWSFNTVKNNMQAIADAGYTAIQTSPAGKCKVGDGGDLALERWWWHYQPTEYTLGNYQLGTEQEFAEMCAVADQYGIGIIVDAVVNHCTSDYGAIADSVKNIQGGAFHNNGEIGNWNDRREITQKALMGLWDLNTQNPNVQNYIQAYLRRCVELGADGFRYDAAKHIELPDDAGFGGDFWPVILNNGSQFQYGEILCDGVSREDAYAQRLNVTADVYGHRLREAFSSGQLNSGTLGNWTHKVSADKLVTWVESHDNYANGIGEYGSSQWMNDG